MVPDVATLGRGGAAAGDRVRPPWLRRGLVGLVAAVLLGQMAVAMVTTAVQQTPTIDEPVYLGAAVAYLQEHDLAYNPEHPPLGKLLIGAGLVFTQPRVDPAFTGDQWALGHHLLYEAGNDPGRLLLAGRLPVIVLTLLFGLVAFAFARELFGPAGGLVALALFTLSPNLVAHGALATLDVPMAGFLLTAVWLVWLARRRPAWCLPLAGAALGAAVATKMSALAGVPVVLLLAALSTWYAAGPQPGAGEPRWRPVARAGGAAVGVGAVAVAVVWLSYLVVDPQLRWAAPEGLAAVGGLRGFVLDLLPFPAPYLDGMRIQFAFEDRTFGGFLFGESYVGSRWYYLPAALLVKTPLGALVLWLAGAAALLAVPRLRPAAPYLLVPAVVLLAAAMTGARDYGIRYAIVVPMFLAVAAAAVLLLRHRWVPVVATVSVLAVAVSSLRTFPYYLPYGNEAFGGPAHTHEHLHDSNVDWGQDLGRLADHLRARYPDRPVWLVYKGSGSPSFYGIDSQDPLDVAPAEVEGLLVVSNSAAARADHRLTALLDTSEPIDQVGHSITIYEREPAAR